MAATRTPSLDAVRIVESLDSRQIRERLDAIDREREALLVLMRAARARERRAQTTSSGVSHAD